MVAHLVEGGRSAGERDRRHSLDRAVLPLSPEQCTHLVEDRDQPPHRRRIIESGCCAGERGRRTGEPSPRARDHDWLHVMRARYLVARR